MDAVEQKNRICEETRVSEVYPSVQDCIAVFLGMCMHKNVWILKSHLKKSKCQCIR